ncbi:hypothetical protein DFH27DRAFT_20194 [Peziza echinospora]|nr:hypothetical protein DFH27DRAFT_20194 [Peziza echinospora]
MGLTQPHAPILDSHIHLFDEAHLDNLAWNGPGGPLYASHSIPEYASCIPPALVPYHRGAVFIEVDCKYSDPLSDSDEDLEKAWGLPLEEYRFVYELAKKSRAGMSVRGIVPWAPVHLGPEMVRRFYAKIKAFGGVVEKKSTDGGDRQVDIEQSFLKGFRYLLQDKPRGTMLTEKFIASLKHLASLGVIFEVGVNSRSGGLWQLEELVQLLDILGDDAPTCVINHLCKPDMYIPPTTLPTHPTFLTYLHTLTALTKHPRTIMKLSGVFAEIPAFPTPSPNTDTTNTNSNPNPPSYPPSKTTFTPLPNSLKPPAALIISQIYPWVSAVFSSFPADRVIWGSDWPVCNIAYLENQQKQNIAAGSSTSTGVNGGDAWAAWAALTELLFDQLLSEGVVGCSKALGDVWGRNAARVYAVDGFE